MFDSKSCLGFFNVFLVSTRTYFPKNFASVLPLKMTTKF